MAWFTKEDKAGLYICVVFHLAIMIFLFNNSISAFVNKDFSFTFDFSKKEEVKLDKEKEREKFREAINKKLEEKLKLAGLDNNTKEKSDIKYRNIATNSSKGEEEKFDKELKQLYEDIQKLEEKLKKNKKRALENDYIDISSTTMIKKVPDSEQQLIDKKTYKGPSVVAWSLDGRKASNLSIPAYRCFGGGKVVVTIAVNNQGKVIEANINELLSSSDWCLRNFALLAAQQSLFSMSQYPGGKQFGEIVYQFIAQ